MTPDDERLALLRALTNERHRPVPERPRCGDTATHIYLRRLALEEAAEDAEVLGE